MFDDLVGDPGHPSLLNAESASLDHRPQAIWEALAKPQTSTDRRPSRLLAARMPACKPWQMTGMALPCVRGNVYYFQERGFEPSPKVMARTTTNSQLRAPL